MPAGIGSKDLASMVRLEDSIVDFQPIDTNLAYGIVACLATTSGDNLQIVRPDNAVAALAGRAYVGVSMGQGSPTLATDAMWAVQRRGIAACALTDSTACTAGQVAAYDPTVSGAQAGKVLPWTNKAQVPIGRFAQTLGSGTSQLVGVTLGWQDGSIAEMLLGEITATGTALSGTTTETSLGSITVPANLLAAGQKVTIDFMVNITAHNGADTIIVMPYLTASPFVAGAALKLGTMAATNLATNNQVVGHYELDIRSTTALIDKGWFAPGALGTANPIVDGLQGSQAYVASIVNLVAISGKWSSNNAGNSCQLEALSVKIAGQVQ